MGEIGHARKKNWIRGHAGWGAEAGETESVAMGGWRKCRTGGGMYMYH